MRFVAYKSEVGDAVMKIVCELDNLISESLRRLTSSKHQTLKLMRTDGGRKYIENEFKDWIKQHGIMYEVTTAYSSESNGTAEGLNWTLLDIARTVLLGMNTQQNDLRAEAVHNASFLRNRLLLESSHERKTPYEIIHGKRPRLKHVRIFDSSAYVQKQKKNRCGKFDSHTPRKILVGYCGRNGCRKILDENKVVVVSLGVKVVKCTDTVRSQEVDSDIVEFNLSEYGVIFDDISKEMGQSADESKLEMGSLMATTGDDRMGIELEAGVSLDGLTYYPSIRRSERRTAGNPPERLGYEMEYMLTEPSGDSEVPGNCDEAASRDETAK